jgi:hypothetical protein
VIAAIATISVVPGTVGALCTSAVVTYVPYHGGDTREALPSGDSGARVCQMQPQFGKRHRSGANHYREPDRAAPDEWHCIGEVLGRAGDDMAVVADQRCHRS